MQPGFYLVTGAPHTGKTALLDYLDSVFRAKNQYVIRFNFDGSDYKDCVVAIAEITKDIMSIHPDFNGRNIMPPKRRPWGFFDDLFVKYGKIVVIIEDLDKIHYDYQTTIKDFLPFHHLENIHLVMSTRVTIDNYTFNIDIDPENKLQLKYITQEDIKNWTIQYQLQPVDEIAYQIWQRSQGRPYDVAAWCCELQRHQNPLEFLDSKTQLQSSKHLAENELTTLEKRLNHDSKQLATSRQALKKLFRDVLGVLAVSCSPIPFDELRQMLDCDAEQLRNLQQCLQSYISSDDDGFWLTSSHLIDYLRSMPNRHGIYAQELIKGREYLFGWCCKRFSESDDLYKIPLYILRYSPYYAMIARESCRRSFVEAVFSHATWRSALEERSGSLGAVRAAVAEAWEAAEKLDVPHDLVFGLTACAIMKTSLVAVLPPEIVTLLVRYALWSEERAATYALGYPTQQDRDVLQLLLQDNQLKLERYAKLTQQVVELAKLPNYEQALRQILQPYERIGGTDKAQMASETLRDAVAPAKDWPASTRSFLQLSEDLTMLFSHTHLAVSPVGDSANLSDEQRDVLEQIVNSWIHDSDIPLALSANRYVQLTRLIASSTRANYLEALTILAPAIRCVFGAECAERMALMVKKITDAYP
ncbi:MAG: hypothetical protein EI684_09395 [Candidatus Viridilinea halotolerans]|uniref:Uncharacterized protein n=1 Tax=Candidatus Viridilinea halotolerans TaxID=2491704 RepID=A0A426U1F1_9CHLR|nr:MAG: hypothetical protein EI684_09395 [Candidatus Viridilinea halotolerans]